MSGTYTAADLAMAAFLASREPWKVRQETFRPSAQTRRDREYDRVTELNLKFLHGQQVAEQERGAA